MPSLPVHLVQPRAGTRSITVFMVGTGVVLLISNNGLRTALDWLRSKTAGAGITLKQQSQQAPSIASGTPPPANKPGSTDTTSGCAVPEGNWVTNFGGWLQYELCVARSGK